MGKKKLAIIDDSQPLAEVKSKQSLRSKDLKKLKVKSEQKAAKSSTDKATGEVEQTTPVIPSASEESQDDTKEVKKSQKPGKAKPRSKKYQEKVLGLDRSKTYPLPEAVDMVKKLNYAKFNATIEAHILTEALGIRGLVSLPYASGKKIRILAFGKGAQHSGADIFGSDSAIEEINAGKINFDLVVTTPEWMPKLAKVARILGPRGLMPNPKNGTITSPSADGLKKAVEGFQSGKTEYKTEPKAPVIHLGLGKIDQPTEELSANIKTLLQTVGKTRIKKVTLSPTMGPSVKVDLTSI